MILLDKDYALGKAENQYYLGYIDECTKNAIIKFLNSFNRKYGCGLLSRDDDEIVLMFANDFCSYGKWREDETDEG